MTELRDYSREALYKILKSIQEPPAITNAQQDLVQEAWGKFLSTNIEPTGKAREAVPVLDEMFKGLDAKTRALWSNGFLSTMKEYKAYSIGILARIEGRTQEAYKIPGLTEDIREVLTPSESWTGLV